MTKIALILPAYNEEQTIAATMESFVDVLPDASIWVVNNRSSDATEARARDAFKRLGCAGGVINEWRPGKGNAVRRAFLEVDADIYLVDPEESVEPA